MILRHLPVQARRLQHKPIEVRVCGIPYLVSWYETKFCTNLEIGYRVDLVLLDSALRTK
jgi:hypothetical protein